MTTTLTFDQNALVAAVRELGLELVVTFGSRGSGDLVPTEDSDLDVAVLDLQPFTPGRFHDVQDRLSQIVGSYNLDLSFLTQADPYFRFEIFRTGCRLCGDPQLYFEQEAYVFKSYVDADDLNALERDLFVKKLAMIDRSLAEKS